MLSAAPDIKNPIQLFEVTQLSAANWRIKSVFWDSFVFVDLARGNGLFMDRGLEGARNARFVITPADLLG